MRKLTTALLAICVLATTGCGKKPDTPPKRDPQDTRLARMTQLVEQYGRRLDALESRVAVSPKAEKQPQEPNLATLKLLHKILEDHVRQVLIHPDQLSNDDIAITWEDTYKTLWQAAEESMNKLAEITKQRGG